MKPFKHEIQKKKWDKLRKRKLRNAILIGCSSALVFAGAGVGIGYIIWHHRHAYDDYFAINNKTTTTTIPKIYLENSTTSVSDIVGIDLQKISNEHNHITKFKIDGTITVPLVSLDGFSFKLVGINSGKIDVSSRDTSAIIYACSQPNMTLKHSKDMSNSISDLCFIGPSYRNGISVATTIYDDWQITNCSFGNFQYGLLFHKDVSNSHFVIKNNTIFVDNNLDAYGIVFASAIRDSNIQILHNTISANSATSNAYGILVENYGDASIAYSSQLNIQNNFIQTYASSSTSTKIVSHPLDFSRAISNIFVDKTSLNLFLYSQSAESNNSAFTWSSTISPTTISGSDNFFYSTSTNGLPPLCNTTIQDIINWYNANWHWQKIN